MQKEDEPKGEKFNRVKVAIRVRPMISKEMTDAETSCTRADHKDTILLGRDR